jgi:predicted LPLAT superfamily acyltransferase
MRITAWLYRRIGRRIARIALYPIVGYFYISDSLRRRESLSYLRQLHSTPEGAEALGAEPGPRQVFRHFLEFGITILDRVGFWMGRAEDFALDVHGMEHLDKIHADKRGGLLLGCHLGSFDAMRLAPVTHPPVSVSVLMYTQHATRINELFQMLGGGSEDQVRVRVIQVEPGSISHALELKACVDRGELVAILADRLHPAERERATSVDFLGRPALLPQGPMRLAALLGCPVLLMVGPRVGDGRYEIHVEPFAERVEIPRERRAEALQEYTQAYADRVAHYCTRTPYQWFNFYDFWAGGGASG